MHIFYKPGLHEKVIILDPAESHHCVNVLRMQKNEEVAVINGQGILYSTRIGDANSKEVKLLIINKIENYGKRDYHLHIAIAPPKNIERFEWFLEKATEIGVDEISPVFCQHSNRMKLRPERLEKVLISAVKQSLKTWLPKLNQPMNFQEFIKQENNADRYIAYCSEDYIEHLLVARKNTHNIIVMVGPEGDFSPTEIAMAIESGFKPVSLGSSRLRTETAGIAVAQIIANRYVIKDFQ